VTPGSGEGGALASARGLAAGLRRRGHVVDVRSFNDLTALTDWARTPSPDVSHVVCIGGDATLSAAALAAMREQVPFVPVPTGFGNVFARVFGYSDEVGAVLRLLQHGELARGEPGQHGNLGLDFGALRHAPGVQQARQRGGQRGGPETDENQRAENRDAAHHQLVVQQLVVSGRDMPGLNLTAQVFIEHRSENKMVGFADEDHFPGSGEVKSGKQPSKPAPENHDSWLAHNFAKLP